LRSSNRTVGDPREAVNTTVGRCYPLAVTEGRTRHEREEAERRAALASLERLRHEGDSLAGSARRIADQFAERDAEGSPGAADPADLWGRRIGRALSLAAFIGLCAYFYVTYLR
jgi:hypothetical protein